MRRLASLRWVFIVLLLGHGVYYAVAEYRERAALRTVVKERIGRGEDALDTLFRSTSVAFNLPPHQSVQIDYGLRHPVMRLLRPSAYQVYRKGGHCAKRSRLLSELLRVQGIPAHKLYLFNPLGLSLLKDPPRAWVHVVVEAGIDGRWVVADPLFNLVFMTDGGRPATVEDLATDHDLLQRERRRADERFDTWEDQLYFYDSVRRIPWFILPVIGERTRAILAFMFTARRVDSWVAPGWVERPQLQLTLGSFALALLLVWNPLVRRRGPHLKGRCRLSMK